MSYNSLEQSRRMRAHNKMVEEGRKLGVLKPLGTQTKVNVLPPPKVIKERAFLSPGGSVLPNRFSCWPFPFDKLTEKDE